MKTFLFKDGKLQETEPRFPAISNPILLTEELTNNHVSEYYNVRINLYGTGYEIGTGWGNDRLKAHNFHNGLNTALIEEGFKIKAGDSCGSCDRAITNPWKKLDLYLHPMEITGYANLQQVQNVLKALDKLEIKYEPPILKEVLTLSDKEYRMHLAENADLVMSQIANYKKQRISSYDYGLQFAQDCRLPRVGDGAGRSSLDADVEFVDELIVIAEIYEKKIKEISKNYEKRLDALSVGLTETKEQSDCEVERE